MTIQPEPLEPGKHGVKPTDPQGKRSRGQRTGKRILEIERGRPIVLAHSWMFRFLAVLRRTANVSKACRRAGISKQWAFVCRKDPRHADFAALWDDAIEDRYDTLEERLLRHATVGWDEPVFGSLPGEHAGSGVVGVKRKYDNRLAVRILEAKRKAEWGRGPRADDDEEDEGPDPGQAARDFLREALASVPGAALGQPPPASAAPAEAPPAAGPPLTGRAPLLCVECGTRLPPATRQCAACGERS